MSRKEPSWLKNAVFYQIYPSSYCDSNGDGMGDIPGIISKLDYLSDIGVNAIWLSPCFKSPFKDGGYDVADFREVDKRFGSNADLEELFAQAHRRNMRVCLDMVAGHTSVEHPWFKESCKVEKNKYSNYFIWNNDWLDAKDGMNMISGMSDRNGSFAINFFAVQPALNYGFANPDPAHPWQLPVDHPDVLQVVEELKNNMRFWLDKGADGFRVDMAVSLVKKDPGKKATMALWRGVREMFDREYPEAALIAEWGYAPQSLKGGFHADFLLHCGTPAYSTLLRLEPERDIFGIKDKLENFFEHDGNDYNITNFHSYFDASGQGSADMFFRIYLDHLAQTADDGYIALITGNHDQPRFSTGRSARDLKVFFAFQLTMPGLPFIYYGDEIGMRNLPWLTSKEGGFTRTQARTPMQWDESSNAGFSTAPAENIYLPIDPENDRPTVQKMLKDGDSLLNCVKALCRLRHSNPALQADGKIQLLNTGYPTVYLRKKGDEKFLVAVNPAAGKWEISLDAADLAGGTFQKVFDLGETSLLVKDGKILLNGDGQDAAVWQIF